MIKSNDDQELVQWEFTIPKDLYDKLQTIWQSNHPNEDFAWSRLVMEAVSRYISDCPSGVARPAKQPEFQLVLHQG